MEPFRGRPPGPPRARLPGVGADLHGLQLRLLLLHRPGRSRAGAEPAAGGHRRGGERPRGRRRARGDAPRPERQLVGGTSSRTSARSSGSSCARSTPFRGSSGSVSRARIRRTSDGDRRRECEAVCEHTHLPLQSGSSRVLKRMRRTYGRERYLALVERLRRDPRSRAHHRHHRRLPGGDRGRLRRDARGRGGGAVRRRTVAYSPRQGTEAAAMPEQVPRR